MSALVADVSFDFTFPSPSIEDPVTPPNMAFSFDPVLLKLPYHPGHARSSSQTSSVYSAVTVDSTPDSVCTRVTTPSRASPPVHRHGPLLLPKIRSQDQDVDATALAVAPVPRRVHRTASPPAPHIFRASHSRSYTNPETLSNMAYAHMSFSEEQSLLCSPASFAHDGSQQEQQQQQLHQQQQQQQLQQQYQQHARRASSLDSATVEKYGYPTYRQMPFMPDFSFPSTYTPRTTSPLSLAASTSQDTGHLQAQTATLAAFLSAPNPAASLVRTVSFPFRDPHTKHFWWDVRSIRSWTAFTASAVFGLPGASSLLTTPVPAALLPTPVFASRHPETESALHAIYASYYIPKLNSALAMSSPRPLQLSVPAKTSGTNDLLFVANAAGESATAAAMFGGKPSARVVGLVRSFDRFNTGMRVEGNVKRVEYLRGLSALHHAMREHGCRYGFILTEIELVVVRCGTDTTPFFGDMELATFQLAADGSASESSSMTACLALWGLFQLAGDETPAGHARWRAEIGAPAEGTRRKAKPRDNWMPQPQLAEKREAKRSRGWVWPEDAIGRKELGKRGVRYGGM